MDYLFIELMLWGRQAGYRWFNLGMAPLSGLEAHPLAPAWHRVGNFIFRHGEHFYNFEGLRRFKGKFVPSWWESEYALSQHGVTMPPRVGHAIVRALVPGGLTQILTRQALRVIRLENVTKALASPSKLVSRK